MLVSRNRASYTYNEETGEQICRAVKEVYYKLLKTFEKKMEQLKEETE